MPIAVVDRVMRPYGRGYQELRVEKMLISLMNIQRGKRIHVVN
jgi:hypothetical protein